MTRRAPWTPPAWTEAPAARIGFLDEIVKCGVAARFISPDRTHRGGFGIEVRLTPAGVDERRVTIMFGRGAAVPSVYADGPTESPHRYADGSLCMWYPADDAECRWERANGARVLLGLIAAHLIREEWWRRTGEWPGDEAPHGPTPAIAGYEVLDVMEESA